MAKGFYMTLLIGPGVPVAAPREVLDALTSVEITTGGGAANGGPASTNGGMFSASGFRLTFTLSPRSPLHTLFLLAGGASPAPILRVIIIVTVNGNPDIRIDGVVTNTQVATSAGTSTLTVIGSDLTAYMSLIDFEGTPFPCMPPEARVALILLKYAVLGIVPLVIPSVLIDVPIPTDRIPRQVGKDLEYINSLADEVGYVFYLTPGPEPGMNVAYWGPEVKVGVPQKALNVDMDAETNVEAINFGFDAESRTMPILFVQIPATKVPIPIPIPDITPLSPPLGAVSPIPRRFERIKVTAKMSPARAALIAMSKAARSAEAAHADGTLDVLRYGRVLKARQLVGVRGAGPAFDGLYYVRSVTDTIKRGEYKQSFKLTRNGLVSTVPRVPA